MAPDECYQHLRASIKFQHAADRHTQLNTCDCLLRCRGETQSSRSISHTRQILPAKTQLTCSTNICIWESGICINMVIWERFEQTSDTWVRGGSS